jgi:hypothetical protein
MKSTVEIYKDMIGQKITGISISEKGEVKFFLEEGILLIMENMEMTRSGNENRK